MKQILHLFCKFQGLKDRVNVDHTDLDDQCLIYVLPFSLSVNKTLILIYY